MELKDSTITSGDALFLAPSNLAEVAAAKVSGQDDIAHPRPQLCLLFGICRGVGALKLFDGSFQRTGDSGRNKNRPFVAIHVTSRNAPAVTASIKSEPKL